MIMVMIIMIIIIIKIIIKGYLFYYIEIWFDHSDAF